jgi:hypothetical protein
VQPERIRPGHLVRPSTRPVHGDPSTGLP